jgi:hypothetical protein
MWQESYNQAVSKLRPAVTIAALLLAAIPAARAQSMDDVLKRAAAYVANFRTRLSGIVAEETYLQETRNIGRFTDSLIAANTRRLRSDLLLVKPPNTDRYVELRDVFEVDGAPVRDRQARLEKLLKEDSAAAGDQIANIIAESARHNLGSITRNVNTPLMALQFLDASNQRRFRFKHVEQRKRRCSPTSATPRSTTCPCSARRPRCGMSNMRSARSGPSSASPTATISRRAGVSGSIRQPARC